MVLFILLIASDQNAKADNNLCPPTFTFTKEFEYATGSFKQIIIYLPKKEYMPASVKQLFHCLSNENPDYSHLEIRVFTNKQKAIYDNFYGNAYSIRPHLNLFHYDASLTRYYDSSNMLFEKYEYRPYLWFPFYFKTVILRSNIRVK